MPKAEELPVASDDFLEIEVATQHGGWHLWEKLPVWRREQLIAHALHKSKRDAYYRERIAKHAKLTGGKEKPQFAPDYDPLEAIKRQMGFKY